MTTIGFYNHVNTKPAATEVSLQSIRKFYPDVPIVLSCDNASDYTEISKKYNTGYHHNNVTLGYPVSTYGYTLDKVLEYLDRKYIAVKELNTDYFVYMEDDVLVINPIVIDTNWDMAGQVLLYEGQVPPMPEKFLDIIEEFSGVRPKQNFYNCGGGTIYKSSTFIDNFPKIRQWFIDNLEYIQKNVYMTLGHNDCFMCVYYLLLGKELNQNPGIYNQWPGKKPFDWSLVPSNAYLVHNYKDYY